MDREPREGREKQNPEVQKRADIESAAVKSVGTIAQEWNMELEEMDLVALRANIGATVTSTARGTGTQEVADAIIHNVGHYFKSLKSESKNPDMPVIGAQMAQAFEAIFLNNIRNIR